MNYEICEIKSLCTITIRHSPRPLVSFRNVYTVAHTSIDRILNIFFTLLYLESCKSLKKGAFGGLVGDEYEAEIHMYLY